MADRAKKKYDGRSRARGSANPSSKQSPLRSHQDHFLKYLCAERRLAANTYIHSYRYDLQSFAEFLRQQAEWLRQQLDQIGKRIEELEGEE